MADLSFINVISNGLSQAFADPQIYMLLIGASLFLLLILIGFNIFGAVALLSMPLILIMVMLNIFYVPPGAIILILGIFLTIGLLRIAAGR